MRGDLDFVKDDETHIPRAHVNAHTCIYILLSILNFIKTTLAPYTLATSMFAIVFNRFVCRGLASVVMRVSLFRRHAGPSIRL